MATYNNEWLVSQYKSGKELELFFFWGHRPDKDGIIGKSCLSQWWQAPFIAEEVVYKTAEHWMMAEKARLFGDDPSREKIIQSEKPEAAKRLGRLIKNFDATTWDRRKFDIVIAGNYHKFSQHQALKNFLFSTKEAVLAEASPVDNIWGIGLAATDAAAKNPAEWKGHNLLGYALMEVRNKLKENTQT